VTIYRAVQNGGAGIHPAPAREPQTWPLRKSHNFGRYSRTSLLFIKKPIQVLFGGVIGGPTLYKMPSYRSSKIFVTRLFWRLRNHTFDGHISGLEQDRDNLKPLLLTKSPMPYRLVPLPSSSRDHTTSGSAFLAHRSTKIVGKAAVEISPVV